MPLCPQITITPITVTSTGMTQTSVVPIVNASTEELAVVDTAAIQALADAAAANATAVQAQADAATAYATAVAANTAASTAQTTADGKNKVTYSTAVPGSTANTLGDIWYQYGTVSPNVGRIIAQYTGNGGTSWTQTSISGLVVANIDAGNITTGTLTAAVGITNPSGNFTVNGVTGVLTATNAVLTGSLVSSAVTVTGGTLTIGTNFQVSNTGVLTASGGAFTTDNVNNRITIGSSNNAMSFYYAGSPVCHLLATTGGAGVILHYGATASPSTVVYPNAQVNSSSASLSASTVYEIASTTFGNVVYGSLSCTDTLNVAAAARFADPSTTSNVYNARMDSSDGRLRRSTFSSARFKEAIADIETVSDLAPSKLLSVPVRAFKFKADYLDATDNRAGVLVPGLIAEEVAEHYPIAADKDESGLVENWNERLILPGMLALIQDLHARVATLEGGNNG